MLGRLPQTQGLSKAARRKLGEHFIDRLFGADMLRILLGLKGLTPHEQKQRAEGARDKTLAAIETELAANADGRLAG